MATKKDYLYFEEYTPEKPRKTKIFLVKAISDNEKLGSIAWNNTWRQYCFYPHPYTHWSRGCLKQVYNFIDELMEDRKRG